MIAGVATVVVMTRRYGLPLGQFAGIVAAPLALAYGIGRIGCFLAGDGTYGKPSAFSGRWPSRTGRCRRWSRSTPPRYMDRRSRSC